MSAARNRWVASAKFAHSEAFFLPQILALCCLLGISLSCRAADILSGDQHAAEALHHFVAGTDCANAADYACVIRESSWLGSSPFPKLGKVLSGYSLCREKRYVEALRITKSVYPLLPGKGMTQGTQDLYVVAHELAASTIGESMFQLKQPDAKVLPALLEGTRLGSVNGMVVDDGALSRISTIYLHQNRLGLSFGFGLERYNIMRRRYEMAPPGVGKQRIEHYLHAEEFRFAVLLAYMDDLGGSREWLAKALSDKDGGYLEGARGNPLLKPVLDSIGRDESAFEIPR